MAYLDSPLFASYLRGNLERRGLNGGPLSENLRSNSGGETRLRIEAVRDLTELN